MLNKQKYHKKRGFTRTPSFVLLKSCVVGDKKGDKKKKNLVCGFTPTPKSFGVTLQSKGGFTLIETLVGITILLVSVVGPLFIAFQGVSLAYFAKDQIVASYLAQEGIEFVRFRIITNSNMGSVGKDLILSGTAYDLEDCSWQSNTGKYCIVDVFNDTVTRCDLDALPGDDCQYIKYDVAAEKYEYTSGTDTLFRRSIVINHDQTLINDDIEFQIESKVEWGKTGDEHEVILKEVVRDWRP